MHNLSLIEEHYQRFIRKLPYLLPEGVVEVDLCFLHEMKLLNFSSEEIEQDTLTRYFHVLETPEKITLINEQFVVWIVPETAGVSPSTHVLIALNQNDYPQLEIAFSAKGVYNSSWLVLRVLERFLHEIQENEEIIDQYEAG